MCDKTYEPTQSTQEPVHASYCVCLSKKLEYKQQMRHK